MADGNESTGATDTDAQSGNGTDAPEQQQQGEPQQQADKDWKAEAEKWQVLARKHEKESRTRAGAAEKLAALEESQKTEAQKVADRAEQAEKRASESERSLARYKVAVAKKLPAELVDRLRGDTEEEIAADADALLALVKVTNGDPKPDLSQGSRTTASGAPDMNSLLRMAAGRG